MKYRNLNGAGTACVCAAWLLSAVAGCGNKKTDAADSKPKIETAPADEATAPAETNTASEAGAPTAEKSVRKLSGTATIPAGDSGGPETTFTFVVEVAERGAADGRATVQGETVRLSGTVRDSGIRLWAAGSEAGTWRGGFFEGTASNGTASGSFVLSGNGPQALGEVSNRLHGKTATGSDARVAEAKR